MVNEIGARKNGYMKCRYAGKTGSAHEAYRESPAANDDPNITGMDATNTDVNLQSGPSTGHQVLRVLNPGIEVSICDTVENGFRYVVHLGLAGWVRDAFIDGPLGRLGEAGDDQRTRLPRQGQHQCGCPISHPLRRKRRRRGRELQRVPQGQGQRRDWLVLVRPPELPIFPTRRQPPPRTRPPATH